MIMSQKTKDLLHAIFITLFEVICVFCFIVGTIYLICTCSGTVISILASILWSVMWALGSCLFGWGTYICWKDWKYWYKDKKEDK